MTPKHSYTNYIEKTRHISQIHFGPCGRTGPSGSSHLPSPVEDPSQLLATQGGVDDGTDSQDVAAVLWIASGGDEAGYAELVDSYERHYDDLAP